MEKQQVWGCRWGSWRQAPGGCCPQRSLPPSETLPKMAQQVRARTRAGLAPGMLWVPLGPRGWHEGANSQRGHCLSGWTGLGDSGPFSPSRGGGSALGRSVLFERSREAAQVQPRGLVCSVGSRLRGCWLLSLCPELPSLRHEPRCLTSTCRAHHCHWLSGQLHCDAVGVHCACHDTRTRVGPFSPPSHPFLPAPQRPPGPGHLSGLQLLCTPTVLQTATNLVLLCNVCTFNYSKINGRNYPAPRLGTCGLAYVGPT